MAFWAGAFTYSAYPPLVWKPMSSCVSHKFSVPVLQSLQTPHGIQGARTTRSPTATPRAVSAISAIVPAMSDPSICGVSPRWNFSAISGRFRRAWRSRKFTAQASTLTSTSSVSSVGLGTSVYRSTSVVPCSEKTTAFMLAFSFQLSVFSLDRNYP